jgi:hypothetical protein
MSRTEHTTTPRRRGLLTGTLAALLTGTAAVATARAASVPAKGDDAELIQLATRATAARQSLHAMNSESDAMELRDVSDDEEREFADRTGRLLRIFWDATDRAEMIQATTTAGLQAKAAILLLVLKQTVAVGLEETLEDIARGEAGESADRFGLALARDMVAWRASA